MFKCSQRQFSVSFFMDEKIDFNLVKIRSKSKRHKDLLLDALLDADDESREVKRGYQLVKDRVHKALLMSDKKIAHEIAITPINPFALPAFNISPVFKNMFCPLVTKALILLSAII